MTMREELLSYLELDNWDAIVTEGYDGVGKSKVLAELSDILGVVPYRPDYNFWQQYNLTQPDRWKISGYFWDIFSHFMKFRERSDPPFLFDRGVISGAVYNNDMSIARNYRSLLRDMNVLHILVVCGKADYEKLARLRFDDIDDCELKELWEEYKDYKERYLTALKAAGVAYVIYENKFDETIASEVKGLCGSCGHYNHGICRHPSKNCAVDPKSVRCSYSNDMEVQDAQQMCGV